MDVCRSERCWATSFISAGSLAKVKHTHQRRASFTRRLSFLFRARRGEFFCRRSWSTSTVFPPRRISGNDVRPSACSRASISSRCSSRLRRKISRSALTAAFSAGAFGVSFGRNLKVTSARPA